MLNINTFRLHPHLNDLYSQNLNLNIHNIIGVRYSTIAFIVFTGKAKINL